MAKKIGRRRGGSEKTAMAQLETMQYSRTGITRMEQDLYENGCVTKRDLSMKPVCQIHNL